VKQTWALLESNLPRDNWIDGEEIELVCAFGEVCASPKANKADLLFPSPEHAF